MSPDIIVREVGPRDGIQNVDVFFPTELKKQWLTDECAAGVKHIQITSFVPPKLLPQFTDSEEITAHALAQPGLVASAFVPNARGAQRAFDTGIHHIGFVASASESHNQSNLRCSTQESVQDFKDIIAMRETNDGWKTVKVGAGIATAFGCTMEGAVDEKAVLRLAEQFLEAGAEELLIADTVGYANPRQVKDLFTQLQSVVGSVPLSAHFHDTRGLGLANVHAALEAGITLFDACLGGLGGCPFAPGATGNIVTEDLVFMLEAMGLATGVDLDKLIAVREILAKALPGEHLYSAIAKAAPPKGFIPATIGAYREN